MYEYARVYKYFPPVQTLFMLQNRDVFLSPHSFKSLLLISVHIKTAFFFNEVDCCGIVEHIIV